MSEEFKTTDGLRPQDEKITSVEKVKDPRRVEAGKRLGMISKQAKEKKLAQMREASAKASTELKAGVGETSDWFSNVFVNTPVVGIGFVGLVGLVLYYGYNKKYKNPDTKNGSPLNGSPPNGSPLNGSPLNGSKTQNSNPKNEAKPKRVYKELDTLD